MNTRTSVAVGIGLGYLLGRKHRFKWAALLGAAAATGRLNGVSAQLLKKGASVMRSTPELSKLADGGGRLFEAGRGAALSAMNSRMDSMEESLKGRTEDLGRIRTGDEDSGQARRRGGRWAEDEDDAYEQDDAYDERDDEDSGADLSDEYDEDDDTDEDDDEPVRAGRRGGSRQSSGGTGSRGARRSTRTGASA